MIVVADTSVILNLSCVEQLDLLAGLFPEVVVPLEVVREFEQCAKQIPRFAGLSLPAWIRQQSCHGIPENLAQEGLDPGETAAIALALELHADAVLIDERHGYTVARQLGLNTVGILGLLLRAKAAGLLVNVKPVLDELRDKAHFWLSEKVRLQVLRLAGEAG